MSFGKLLRDTRTDRQLTLEDVANRLGVSVPHLSRIERDRENPPRDGMIQRIGKILGLDEDVLFAEARRLPPDLQPRAGEVFAAYRRMAR